MSPSRPTTTKCPARAGNDPGPALPPPLGPLPDRRSLIEYPLPPWGVKNQPFQVPGQKAPCYRPRNRKQSSQEEEKRLRAIDPVIGAYVDFILGSPGLLRHQFLRRLWALRQRWSTALFLRTIQRAHATRSPAWRPSNASLCCTWTTPPCPIRGSIQNWKSVPPIKKAPHRHPRLSAMMNDTLAEQLKFLRLPGFWPGGMNT